MSAVEVPASRVYADVLADAVRVLTEAARLRSRWTSPDGVEHERPVDWAEFVAQATAAAAANVGGVEQVLAGRPGSWEADALRQLLVGTVGEYDQELLLVHRTEPLRITLHVNDHLDHEAFWEPYEAAGQRLDDSYRTESVDGVGGACIIDHPDNDAVDALQTRLYELQEADRQAFGAAVAAHIEAAAAAMPTLAVPVQVTLNFTRVRPQELADGDSYSGLEHQLLDDAVRAVPQPGAGRAPLERLAERDGAEAGR